MLQWLFVLPSQVYFFILDRLKQSLICVQIAWHNLKTKHAHNSYLFGVPLLENQCNTNLFLTN